MINNIKTLIIAADCCESVELSQDHEPIDSLSDIGSTPTAIIFFGDTAFAASDGDIGVRQQCKHEFIVQLIARSSELMDVQEQLIKAVMGYQHTQRHCPLEAVSIKTHAVYGEFYSRLITFSSEQFLFKT